MQLASTRVLLLALSLPLLIAGSGSAATLTLALGFEFSGATAPTGPAPWLVAVFDDSFGGPNDVRLTLTTPNLVAGASGERVRVWLFNFDPALDPTLLGFTPVDVVDAAPTGIATGANAFKADGDGFFDVEISFGNKAAFTGNETVIYDISYAGPIAASSFAFSSAPGGLGGLSLLSAAQVQSIGPAGESGWVGVVPEPGTGALLAIGLLALAAARRR